MSFTNPEDHEITVAANRLIVQTTISEKAWLELEALGDSDTREALEDLIVKGLVSENEGVYSLTEKGQKHLGDAF